jgi:dipeptidyl aminopeptidase/acylaminoacyl peptidase
VGQLPEADPWFFASRDGKTAREARSDEPIPDRHPSWSRSGQVAAWTAGGSLFVANGGGAPHAVLSLNEPLGRALTNGDGTAVQVAIGEDLYLYTLATGQVRQVTRKHLLPAPATEAAAWLKGQQLELFARVRDSVARRRATALRGRTAPNAPQAIPVPKGTVLEQLQLSPDGQVITFVARTPAVPSPVTAYMDYVTESGQAETRYSRGKVGEPQDRFRFGMVKVNPAVDPDSVRVTWVDLPEAHGGEIIPVGPYWSVEGDRAVVQFSSADWHDLWIAEVNPSTGATKVLAQNHDDAWLGGPPIQAQRGEPALLEWLPGGSIVFASERTGWSHLYRIDPQGTITPLTSGSWEVRDAELSRDRSRWLIAAGRESASDDQLYQMPAAGGELVRLTDRPGRHVGALSPNGDRIADLYGEALQLPDLFLRDAAPGAPETRVTVSGTDAFFRHRLVRPEIASVTHPDGKPVWVAVYRPAKPNGAALFHVHGGGYRQFTHHGWSVYGFALHVGLIHALLERGYTVLDFDYRGGAGYGRDYRTDIYRSMGQKDIDGALPAIDYLVRRYGIDRRRVGVYGVSYGGFFTLMALFRHPGAFAAGIANAAVTDWAHYSHDWTSPILGVPAHDSAAYRLSSPIYYTSGLADPLLIIHGLVDDNVEFQDAARLMQKLIEEKKRFEVMVYPTEPHTIQTESSRRDFVYRSVEFFDRHLLGRK